MKVFAALLGCFLYLGVANAESINRCTDSEGKVSYSTMPCPTGTSTAKKLDIKNPSPPVADAATMPDWKKQEAEFQNRRNNRLHEEYQAEQRAARIAAQEEANRREREELRLKTQIENGQNAAARRWRENAGFKP